VIILDSYESASELLPLAEQGLPVPAATILISELDPDVQRLLIVLVSRLGHEPVVLDSDVSSPPRADLLLLEPSSARCLEHARLVRAYFPDVPVVCMGALPDEGAFLRAGPLDFLPKPFTVEQMRAVIERTVSPV
jgi:DNA-binding NtrC family response regulator